jgi:hypothetical protein
MNRFLISSLLFTSLLLNLHLTAVMAAEVEPPIVVKKTTKTKIVKPAPKKSLEQNGVDKSSTRNQKPSTKAPSKKAPEQIAVDKNTIEESGVRYELTSCKRVSETLVCRFLLTNNGLQDISVSLKAGGTRFIDITGEEYLAKEVNIGTSRNDSTVESILIPKVPIKATITFDEPATNIVTLKVLAISHEPGAALKFRDLKIIK